MKRLLFLLPFLCVFYLSGCESNNSVLPSENQVRILKDGKVEEFIIESFDKDYYDMDELHEFVISDIQRFNQDEELIKIKNIEEREEFVQLTYEFETLEAYNNYMKCTITKESMKNYDGALDIGDLYSVKTQNKVTEDEWLKLEKAQIISIESLDEKLISVPGKIEFISENFDYVDEYTVKNKTQAIGFIIYK
jgi:hypothetical protein